MIEISSDDPVFDPADSDPSVSPAEDFYRFANGGWLDENPVPPEYGAWGAAHEVHVRNEAILHEILKDAATSAPDPDSVQAAVGSYFRSGMDIDTVETLGLTPLQPWLDRIDAMKTIRDLGKVVADFHRIGIGVIFGVSVIPDFDEPTANLDSKTSAHLMDLFVALNQKHDTTFLIATHDTSVMAYARRLIKMPKRIDQIIRMDIVTHLLALITKNFIRTPFYTTLH